MDAARRVRAGRGAASPVGSLGRAATGTLVTYFTRVSPGKDAAARCATDIGRFNEERFGRSSRTLRGSFLRAELSNARPSPRRHQRSISIQDRQRDLALD